MLKKMKAWLGQGFLLIGGPKPEGVDVTEMQVEGTLPEATVTWSPPWLRPITAGRIEAGSLSPITAGRIEAGTIVDAPVDVPPWLRASQSPGEYVALEDFQLSLATPAIDESPVDLSSIAIPAFMERTFRPLPFINGEPGLYAVHRVFELAEERFPGVRRRIMALFGKELVYQLTMEERKLILRAWRRAKESRRAAQAAKH